MFYTFISIKQQEYELFLKLIEEMNPAYRGKRDKLQAKGMIVQQIHDMYVHMCKSFTHSGKL